MFSLIELLITVAVIAILAGLLLPALNSARQKGQAIRCVSNLKQQGNCHSLYAADFDDWIILLLVAEIPSPRVYRGKTAPV